jgi:hypothetical protein
LREELGRAFNLKSFNPRESVKVALLKKIISADEAASIWKEPDWLVSGLQVGFMVAAPEMLFNGAAIWEVI